MGGSTFTEAVQRKFNLSQAEAAAAVRGESGPGLEVTPVIEQSCEGIATALFSRESQRGDVQSILSENRGNARDRAFHVFSDEHDRVVVAMDLHRKAVDLRDEHASGTK